jgi:hypothetical protein
MGRLFLCLVSTIVLTSALAAQEDEGSEPASTFGTTVVLPAGLRGTVYLVPKDITVLPDFEHEALESAGEIWTEALNVTPRHWRAGFPTLTDRFEWFAIDYSGRFWIEEPGRYTFALLSDDGSRLFVDGTPVIDNDCLHPPDLRVAAVRLEGGGHQIRVSYFQGPRDCLALVLAICGHDQRWRVFTTKEFKPPSNPENWRYPPANSVTLVQTTPEEASLTRDELLKKLASASAKEKHPAKGNRSMGCMTEPVRTCGRR